MIVFALQNRFQFPTIFSELAHAQTFFRGVRLSRLSLTTELYYISGDRALD